MNPKDAPTYAGLWGLWLKAQLTVLALGIAIFLESFVLFPGWGMDERIFCSLLIAVALALSLSCVFVGLAIHIGQVHRREKRGHKMG